MYFLQMAYDITGQDKYIIQHIIHIFLLYLWAFRELKRVYGALTRISRRIDRKYQEIK